MTDVLVTNRRILLVDDNPAIHEDFRKVLGEQAAGASALADARAAFFGVAAPAPAQAPGYEIDSAHQGQEALQKVEAALAEGRPYALAFVDVRMPPGWDGIETLARVFEVDARMQAVICTAYSDHSWAEIHARLGRSDRLLILKKPFDNVEVQQLASSLTEKWNAEARERARIEEARAAERQARAYAVSLSTTNRALETARAAAVAAARAKSEFLANMSHEIRTPMIAILGAAELLREGALEEPERRTQLEAIRGEGQHLLTMLSDILDLSSIEAGKLSVAKQPCALSEVIEEVRARHADAARQKGLELKVQVDDALPAQVSTDAARLRQILSHLVANGIKFSESGAVRIVAGSRTSAHGERQVVIAVEDTGVGITPEQRGRLFEAFSQADASLTRKHGGAGLGLALSRRLAQVLGGDLDVESAAGRGSRFTLTFPLDVAGTSASRTALPGGALRARILLVEDVAATQRLYALYLQRAGAEVEVASNGQEGVEKALAARRAGRGYDVILMDMQMPVLDGYSATKQLRAEGHAGPIVAVTAHALAGDRERCLEAGCDEYLAKPVEREQLVATCREWLGKSVPAPLPSATAEKDAAPSGEALTPSDASKR